MKQARLICMIALAGAVAMGCGTTEAGSSIPVGIGTGATSGTGATGGGSPGMGACTNPADAMVYADLAEPPLTGVQVVSAAASNCVFGSCSEEAFKVLGQGGNTQPNRDALGVCVVACTEAIAPLTDACLDCYGVSVVCSAANCASAGCTTPTAASCVECRCGGGNNVTGTACSCNFDICSGLTPSGDCTC